MKRIAYTRKDGGLTIVIPAPKATLERAIGPLTDDQYESHVWERSVPADAINPRYIEDDEIPADRSFRNAWVDRGGITHCMDKCRAIHMDRIRDVRNEKLKELDIETMKGNDVQAQKQVLRDLPNNVDLSNAKTPDELKAIWPEQLI